MEYVQLYWKYIACVVLGLLIGIWLPFNKGGASETIVTAAQHQQGTISTKSHIIVEPVAAQGPCPQLPKITVDCGGEASGSQGQTVTASVSVKTGLETTVGLGVVFDNYADLGAVYVEIGPSVGAISIPLRIDTKKRVSFGVNYRF